MDFNVLLNDPDVLRLDINTLMYRLVKLIHSPSLSVFKHHPRLGNLLQQSRVASERMIILKKLDMDCYDLDLLTCSNSTFLKYDHCNFQTDFEFYQFIEISYVDEYLFLKLVFAS